MRKGDYKIKTNTGGSPIGIKPNNLRKHQIGEDPAYFIQEQKSGYTRFQNHLVRNLNRVNWENEFWMEEGEGRQSKTTGSLRIKPIASDSNLLKKRTSDR